MKLYVLRHGPAVDDAPSGRDEDRALTREGRTRVHRVAEVLTREGEVPEALVTSPLVRALQTAEIVAAHGDLDDRGGLVEVRRELAPGGGHVQLVRELRARGLRSAMVVGHEPDLSSLVAQLLGKAMPVAMAKGMVVGLTLTSADPLRATLRFILDPKSLVWEHDARDSSSSS